MLGAEALVMRLVVDVHSSRIVGARQAAPRSTGLRLSTTAKRTRQRQEKGSMASSSVYLFALEAYSSPIPTASAMGLWSAVGAWWRKAGGGGELGPWHRQTSGMMLVSFVRCAVLCCCSVCPVVQCSVRWCRRTLGVGQAICQDEIPRHRRVCGAWPSKVGAA